jgi:peptidoglycan/xylan/chitin deacetylase (PgdA/CDA1 family)
MKGWHRAGKSFRWVMMAGVLLTGRAYPQAPVATSARNFPETPFIVLCYHRFLIHPDERTNPIQAEYQMPLEEFKWQMQYLKDNGFTPVTSQQIKDYWFQGKPLPLKPVLITFDDGFRTVYRDAYPIIKNYHYPSIFFLYTNFIKMGEMALKRSQETSEPSKNKKLETEALHDTDILEMQKSGMDFQSHTTNHLNLALESEKRTEDDFLELLRSELTEPISFIEKRFGNKPDMIAFPYGVYSPEILEQTQKAGYVMAFTVNPGPNDRSISPLKLRRNLILYPIGHKKFAEMFEDRVLHLENLGPGDGEEITSDTPLISAEVKDDIDPKSIEVHIGDSRLKVHYDPKIRLVRHQLTTPLKQGGHMLTLSATDTEGHHRVYTWYFRIKHKHLKHVEE